MGILFSGDLIYLKSDPDFKRWVALNAEANVSSFALYVFYTVRNFYIS